VSLPPQPFFDLKEPLSEDTEFMVVKDLEVLIWRREVSPASELSFDFDSRKAHNDRMKSIQYTLHREDAFWVAQCLNVDVSSFGSSREEAVSKLKEAVELYLEDSGDDYLEISDVSVGEELAYA
jgi:predicted RNase H-like HicB family nuclease